MNQTPRAVSGLGLLAIIAAAPAVAQKNAPFAPGIGLHVGYAMNLPREPLGVAVMIGLGKGWTAYVDRKVSSLAPYTPDSLSAFSAEFAETIGLPLVSREFQTSTVNLAVGRRIARFLVIYAGAGTRKEVEYKEYLDTIGIISPFGFKDIAYWAQDKRTARRKASLMGGVLLAPFKVPFSLQVGMESEPKGVTVGVFYKLGN
jgi:hypothetical protein